MARHAGGTHLPSLLWAALLLSVFPIAWLAAPLILADRIPVCVFRLATGRPCPFCGLTRAFACAAHGDFAAAWAHHALWPLAAAVIAVFATTLALDAFVLGERTRRLKSRLVRHGLLIVVALSAFGLVRLCR